MINYLNLEGKIAVMTNVVFDTSVLLAIFQGEVGAEEALEYLPYSMMSYVNISEVIYVLVRNNIELMDARSQALRIIAKAVPYDEDQAVVAAAFKTMTKMKGISLGDCACLALGYIHKCKIITADKNWKKLGIDGLNIEFIR